MPPSLCGCTALASFGLLLLTPETSNLPLFDTIQQVENHHKKPPEDSKIPENRITMQTNLGFERDVSDTMGYI